MYWNKEILRHKIFINKKVNNSKKAHKDQFKIVQKWIKPQENKITKSPNFKTFTYKTIQLKIIYSKHIIKAATTRYGVTKK